MAHMQRHLEAFDKAIRLGTTDEQPELRQKRDRLLSDLKTGLARLFSDSNQTPPGFEHFNQGSYAMRTGIRPLDGEYDIDVGIVFDIKIRDHPDPVVVKLWVAQALEGGARTIEVHRSCIRVIYHKNNRPAFHVDLAIYGQDSKGRLYLARGKEHSNHRHRRWERANPQELLELVQNHFGEGIQREQFRRIVRLLKRWRDHCFPSTGSAAPVGIGLTVLALAGLVPVLKTGTEGQDMPNDCEVLERFVTWMLRRFSSSFEIGLIYIKRISRIKARLPMIPESDVLAKMTDAQMLEFKAKLEELRSALASAKRATTMATAIETLRACFGTGFPSR